MTSLRAQRGSMAITLALLLLGLIAMLGLVEIGYLYWAHRDVQKVADLAALSGAQRLNECTDENNDNSAARLNATDDNGFKTGTNSGKLDIACGYWAPDVPGDEHFQAADTDAGQSRNAVRVTASRPLTPFFGFADFNGVSATAIAANRGKPIAAFSVGSGLLGVNTDDSVLAPLLGGALGTSLGLNVLSVDGIANTNISLLGLKNLLSMDAGTLEEVLGTDVNVGQLLDATVTLIQQDGNTANVDLDALRQQIALVKARLGDVDVTLGDILSVDANTTDPDKALDVDVKAGDLISVALQAANNKHALEIPSAEVDLLGLASVGLKLAVIEPPKIGIGGPGTTAHTAQIRLKLDIKLLNPPQGDILKLSIPLVANVDISTGSGNSVLELPLNLEVVPATATLQSIECHAPGPSQIVKFDAQPGLLHAFLGNLPTDAYTNTNRTWESLVGQAKTDKTAYAHLLSLSADINLLFIPVAGVAMDLAVYADIPLSAEAGAGSQPITFNVDPTISVEDQNLSETVSLDDDLLKKVNAAVLDPSRLNVDPHLVDKIEVLGLGNSLLKPLLNGILGNTTALLQGVIGLLSPVLEPVFDALDQALLGPLLNLLGVNVGEATVHLMSVDCNTGAQLVY